MHETLKTIFLDRNVPSALDPYISRSTTRLVPRIQHISQCLKLFFCLITWDFTTYFHNSLPLLKTYDDDILTTNHLDYLSKSLNHSSKTLIKYKKCMNLDIENCIQEPLLFLGSITSSQVLFFISKGILSLVVFNHFFTPFDLKCLSEDI